MHVVGACVVLAFGCGRVGFDSARVDEDAMVIDMPDARVPLALEAGFPVLGNLNSTTGTTIMSPMFSTVRDDVLLVAVFVWGTGGTNQTPLEVTGGGLVWSRQAYSTFLPGPVPPGTSGDGIWTAWADAPVTDIRITATRGTTVENAILTLGIYAFSGANPVVGATGTHTDQTGLTPLLVSVDATMAGSWILGGFHHGTAGILRTATTETQFDLVNDPTMTPNGHFHAIGRLREPTTQPGMHTIGSQTMGPYSLTSAIEVRPAI